MLPQLGEMLSKDNLKAAAPFMSGCIIVTQLVIAVSAAWIGRRAATKGRKPLLLLGFGVLPIRGVLYTLTHAVGALIAIQTLDGVANAIFGIVSILVIKDRTQGTGRFNVAGGNACDDGRHRGSRKHDNRWRVDSAYRVSSVFSGFSRVRLARLRIALVRSP